MAASSESGKNGGSEERKRINGYKDFPVSQLK